MLNFINKSSALAGVYLATRGAKSASGPGLNNGGMCTIENEMDLENVINWVDSNYRQKDTDGEDIVPMLGIMASESIKLIKNTGRAPCQMISQAMDSFKGLGDGVGFNCHDDECDVAIDLRGIWGYGCWCHFGNRLLNGRGTPVSPHDEACKRMQLCLRCAEMDGIADGYECDPRTVSYNSTLGQAMGQNDNINSINSGCQIQNPNDKCGAHTCTCEVQLINDILELVWNEHTHDPTPRHPSNPMGGIFDYQSICVTDPGITEIDCCGKYPFRYTYNSLNKECCDPVEKLFNPFDTMCCPSGLRKVGDGGCD